MCRFVLVAAFVCCGISAAPPANVETPVKERVNLFYDRIAKGKAAENEAMFLKPEVPVTGFGYGREERPFFVTKSTDYLKRHGDQPKYYVVDRIDVDRIHNRLAVARVEWKTGGARGHSVITWSSDGKDWRIVGFFEDMHFVW